MTNLSRRHMLRVVAAAPVAAIVPATSIRAAAALAPQEDPDLIALDQLIDAMLTAYRGHVQSRQTAREFFERERPALQTEMVRDRRTDKFYLQDCVEKESDIDGKTIYPTACDAAREIFSSRLLRAEIIMQDVPRYTKKGKVMRRLARLAKRYETDTATALKLSGYDKAANSAERAARKIEELAREVRNNEPSTMAGVLIHARAVAAFEECATDAGHGGGLGGGWLMGDRLAKAVLRIASR